MQYIVSMVRQGFDRQDLMEMPQPELKKWWEECQRQIAAENKQLKRTNTRGKR